MYAGNANHANYGGTPTFVNDEIYNYLVDTKNGIYSNNKKKYKKNGFEEDLDTIPEDKKINPIPVKGLDDNNNNDHELKSKARKGLLLLLNKMSGGSFCPDINKYFKKLHEEHEINLRTSRKETKKVVDVPGINNKTIRRQNYIDKLETVKDLKNNESIKDEDILKLNLRNNEKRNLFSGSKVGMLTLKNKKTKEKRQGGTNQGFSLSKPYRSDIRDGDLKLYYSSSDIENGKKKLNERKLRPGLNREKKKLQSMRMADAKNRSKKKMQTGVFQKTQHSYVHNNTLRMSNFKKTNLQLEKNIESFSD
jgi:hypothetical protein